MVDKAREIGANGIIGADFETSDILQGVATVFASYGTAVLLSGGTEPATVPQTQATGRTCSNCGKPVPSQAKFCPSCGSGL
jgi:hypothetical protein